MNLNIEDVKNMIVQNFNARTNNPRGKIDFTKNAEVLDGIARTYMYYHRNFPDKIDSSKIDGAERFGKMLNKQVPDNMADLYLGRLLLNMQEIGETASAKGLVEDGGIYFDKASMGRQINYWKKDVAFSKNNLAILNGSESTVTKNLSDKVVVHELSHMSAIPTVFAEAGFYSGTNLKDKQTYASRLEEICAEATALNVTYQKIPSYQKIVNGNVEVLIGGYNPESSNYKVSSLIELAPFAFGKKDLEVGRLTNPVAYMEELNSKYSAFGRNGGTFAGRVQEDLKAITDNNEYHRLASLQADFIKIGMSRITSPDYLNTCDESQFKQDVGFMLRLDELLFKFYENKALKQTENVVTYDKAMKSIEDTFNLLKTEKNMFDKYNSFADFKAEGLMAIENTKRKSLGLSPVANQTNTNSTNNTNPQVHTSYASTPQEPINQNATSTTSAPLNNTSANVATSQNVNANNVSQIKTDKYSYETIDISTEKVGEVSSDMQYKNARYAFVYESMKNLFDDCINPSNPESAEIITRAKRLWSAMAYDNGMRIVRGDGKKKSVMNALRDYYLGVNGFNIENIPSTILSNPEIPNDIKSLFEDLYITKGLSGMADIMEVDFPKEEVCGVYSKNCKSSSATIEDYNSQFGAGDIGVETRKYLRDNYNFYGGKIGASFEDKDFYKRNQEGLLKYLSQDLELAKQRNLSMSEKSINE